MTRRILSDFLSSRSESFYQKDPKNGEYSNQKQYHNLLISSVIKFTSKATRLIALTTF